MGRPRGPPRLAVLSCLLLLLSLTAPLLLALLEGGRAPPLAARPLPGRRRHRWGVRRRTDETDPPGTARSGEAKPRAPPPAAARPADLGPPREPTHQKACDAGHSDCSAGCIAVVGNGPRISNGQAAVATGCDLVYRANYLNSASNCFRKTTHCFFYTTNDAFAGVRRRVGADSSPVGKARTLGIRCPHTVFLDGYLEDKNMTWSEGTSETFTHEMLREELSRHWDPNEKLGGRLPKDPFKKPSSGMFMIGHAVKNMGRKCVHIMGFNFHFREHLGEYKREHPFTAERRLVQNIIRERRRVFFHPLVETAQPHSPGQLVYGV